MAKRLRKNTKQETEPVAVLLVQILIDRGGLENAIQPLGLILIQITFLC